MARKMEKFEKAQVDGDGECATSNHIDESLEDSSKSRQQSISDRNALLAAVEGGGPNGLDVSDEQEKDIVTKESAACGMGVAPIVELFYSHSSTKSAAKEQRNRLLGLVRDRSNFNKAHARRLFAGLADALEKICEEEAYVPESAYEREEDTQDEPLEELEEYAALSYSNADTRQAHRPSCQPATTASDVVPDEKSTEALLFMRSCAIITEAYLNGLVDRRKHITVPKKEESVIEEIMNVAELLHETLFSLQTCGVEGLRTQEAVSCMCERWWYGHFQYRELLVTQLVPLLLVKSLDGDARASDVKRMFSLRDALSLLDFDDGSISYLRSLLMKTVSSPLYLKTLEGRQFIVCLFQLHHSLIPDIHAAIRTQIPSTKRAVLHMYGDIYFRAWKATKDNENIRVIVEENTLQDLMYSVLHVSNPSTVKAIRCVLETLHFEKKDPDIDALLYRMYGPILWRSLNSANPIIRVNAVSILAESFPLHDPNAGQIQTDASIQKGINALIKSLNDSHPNVRIAGARASASILATFWDALPSESIRTLLTSIVTRHASDTSSSAVRATAVISIDNLLQAPHSHAVLRDLLPLLGNLIHDQAEKVRLVVVKLLISVKQLKGIKFYHVVPVDHLLARLAAEGRRSDRIRGALASALTSLLLNSYFPQGEHVTGSMQIQRSLSLLTTSPRAAAVFYANVSSHLNVNAVCKLIAMLLKCLKVSVAASQKENQTNMLLKKLNRKDVSGVLSDDEMKRDLSSGRQTLTATNTSLMATIADTLCILWDSISSELKEDENKQSHEFLLKSFSDSDVYSIFVYFRSKLDERGDDGVAKVEASNSDCFRICSSVLLCAGRVLPENVVKLQDEVRHSLERMEGTGNCNAVPLIAAQCLWGSAENVSSSIGSALSSLMAIELDDADRHRTPVKNVSIVKTRQGKRGEHKRIDSGVSMTPVVALRALNCILAGVDPSAKASRQAILSSDSACHFIEVSLERALHAAEVVLNASEVEERQFSDADVGIILASCETYGKFALHKAAALDGELLLNDDGRTLLKWITNVVFPAFVRKRHSLGSLNLSKIASDGDSPVPPFSPVLEPPRSKNRNSTPLRFSGGHNISLGFDRGIPTFVYGRAAAIALLKSTFVLFSEWVASGCSDCREVASHCEKWCDPLFSLAIDSNVADELVPMYCRLMVQLVLSSQDWSTLQTMLSWTHEGKFNEKTERNLMDAFSLLLRLSGRETLPGSRHESFLDFIFNEAKKASPLLSVEEESSVSFQSILFLVTPLTRLALVAITDQHGSRIALAKFLMRKLNMLNETQDPSLAFLERICLKHLCECAEASPIWSDARIILRLRRQ